MTKKSDLLEVRDTTGLTDADWAEINKWKRAYDAGGLKALSAAMDALLAKDPFQSARVAGALWPDLASETARDTLAEKGITKEDLLELIRKLESPSGSQH